MVRFLLLVPMVSLDITMKKLQFILVLLLEEVEM